MKKKHLVFLLLTVGITLVLLSVILTCNALQNVSIIGGAGWHTFWFAFRTQKGGLYYYLASLGLVSIIASIIVGIFKKKNL